MKGWSVDGSAGGGDMGPPRKMTGSIGRPPTSRCRVESGVGERSARVSRIRACPVDEAESPRRERQTHGA